MDRYAAWFTPAILLAAAATFLVTWDVTHNIGSILVVALSASIGYFPRPVKREFHR